MKKRSFLLFLPILLVACHQAENKANTSNLIGTWRLISATTITKGVSTVTDYTKNTQMIKIITDTHFAFLKHDLTTPKDSVNHFDAGGGTYQLKGNQYTERLNFYADKNWEKKNFTFSLSFDKDTLIQKGIEKVEKANINRVIIEKYIRLSKSK